MTEVDNLVAARGTQNKKLSPQEAWMQLLHSSIPTAPPAIKSYLETMVQLDNVPRKEKQFRNFATNSLNFKGNNAKKELDSIWNFLKEQKEKQQKQKEEEQAKQQKAKEEKAKQAKEEKEEKSKASTSSTTSSSNLENENVSPSEKNNKTTYKNVKKATKRMLKKAPGQSMKYKSLQKALREKVGVSKEKLKEVMDEVVAKESKKFMLEGKQIKLKVS